VSKSWGDPALAEKARRLLGGRHPVAAVATVTRDGPVVAGWGADPGDDFEIGSISKGITGLIYRDAVERGVVRGSTTLGELLPLRKDSEVVGIRLEALSQHRSGLPRLPRGQLRRSLRLGWSGANPYGDSLEELIRQAERVRLRGSRRPHYSNFGFELLGHALAHTEGVARTTYPDLVRERIAGPLGLKSWYLPATWSDLRPSSITGRSRRGRSRAAWTGEALGPAGGLRSAIGDLAELTGALLEERVPGVSALDPVARFSEGARIGAAWITLEYQGRAITWHNGGTGGFRSWLGMDREAEVGVVLVSATAVSVDRAGFRLLSDL
jgi:CubicO group peptidase (beta-lactamase class C family)